jgi:immunity protein 26 of polymorphic toxin system
MSNKKKSGWNAKPRTRLRYIKPGDLFMFRLDDSKHGVGRIISKVSLGHVAEFFEVTLDSPELQGIDLAWVTRRGHPVVLDSYSLFDRKTEGDWQIVGHGENFAPKDVDDVFFTYGVGPVRHKVDVFGNTTPVSAQEAEKLPLYAPHGDADVKRKIYQLMQ